MSSLISNEKYIDKVTGEELIKGTRNDGINNAIIYYNQNNQLHRVDGPAVEYSNGYKAWYQNAMKHCLNGPAVIRGDGSGEWYINGKKYTELDFNVQVRKMKMENL